MNKKKIISIISISILAAILITGCTQSGAASSWPGATIAEEVGYFCYRAQVYAIDAKNGSVLWRYPQDPDTQSQFYAPPETGEDLVVVGNYANNLSGLDQENGNFKWDFSEADDRYVGSALIENGRVFAPNSDKYLYVLDLDGELLWRFKADGPNWTKPVADGKHVFLASMDHSLYAFDLDYASNDLVMDEDGSHTLVPEPVWKVDLGAAIAADPLLVNDRIFAATIGGRIFAVDVNNGDILWSFDNGGGIGSIWGTPVATEKAVYFGDENGNLYSVFPSDGSPIWPTPYSAGAALIAGGVETEDGVIYVTEEGRVFLIDENKEPQPVTTLDTTMYSTPVYAEGKVIFAPASNEKLFTAIDLDGKEIWSFAPSE